MAGIARRLRGLEAENDRLREEVARLEAENTQLVAEREKSALAEREKSAKVRPARSRTAD